MAKFRGVVRRSDLEGGHWQLVADDGSTYLLEGGSCAPHDGARVEVDGAFDRGAVSISMTGPTLRVKGIRAI